jgi:hypothetical protein
MFRSAITTNKYTNMKKIAFIAAAVFCSPVAFAQEAPVAATVAPAAEAEALVDAILGKLEDMVQVLESVNDRATADAAAEKIAAIKAEVEALTAQGEALGEPDEATQERIAAKAMTVIFTIAPRIEEAGARIEENDFYGSEALKNVINEM